MFRYIYPQFKKKRLLRVEMLEQLRDFPAHLLNISFQDYQNGFLKGSKITWNDGILTVGPAALLYDGKLYCMDHTYHMECYAMDQLQFLKIHFEAIKQGEDGEYGDTKIVLDAKETDPKCQIELCRFRLQEGARLRCNYESFQDFSTEYDTVHITHVPFAAEGESTVSPLILKAFANEMLQSGSKDSIDIAFAMNILAAEGRVPREYINAYLLMRIGERANQLEHIYSMLLQIKNLQEGGASGLRSDKQDNRKVLLI